MRRDFVTSTPRFSKRTLPPDEDPAKLKTDARHTIPPDMWIEALENTASAPWLYILSTEHGDRLERGFSLIFQIVLYLSRSQPRDVAAQFLEVSQAPNTCYRPDNHFTGV